MGSYNCPSDNGTAYTPSIAPTLRFTRLCDLDFTGGSAGVLGSKVKDLRAFIATSLEACIDQCAADRSTHVSNCSAVSYGANITLALSRGGINGNCFLKDQRSVTPNIDNSGQEESAFLADTTSD
jgi:hypothetical protein